MKEWQQRAIFFGGIIAYVMLFSYHIGKERSDRWHQEHPIYKEVPKEHVSVFTIAMAGGTATIVTPGSVDGGSTLVIRNGLFCRVYSFDGLEYHSECFEIKGE